MIANWNYLLANFLALVGVGMALTASIHALLSKRDSKSAMAWIAVSIVLPFAGPVLYLVFGINRIGTAAQESYQATAPIDNSEPVSQPTTAHCARSHWWGNLSRA